LLGFDLQSLACVLSRIRISIFSWVLCVLSAAATNAQVAQLLSAEDHAQWQAIGRVNQAGYKAKGLCTGTLIAADLVLTAAHCVHPRRPGKLTFVAGWFRGEYVAARDVTDIHISCGFIRGDLTMRGLSRDVAVLRLEQPISQITPLSIAPPRPLSPATLLHYSGARPHALEVQTSCKLSEAFSAMITPCRVAAGNSGGPVLQQDAAGAWHVVAVIVARRRGGAILAVPSDDLLERGFSGASGTEPATR
jgi:protease YdgD